MSWRVSGEIYLFGSRVDDTKKGGDIDLFIQTERKKATLQNKITFLASLKEKIGAQKIDLLFSKDRTRSYKQRYKVMRINRDDSFSKKLYECEKHIEKLNDTKE